jgi:hypothetical protein
MMLKHKWLIAAVGVALVVVLGGGVVMAQSTGTGTGSTFLDRVAQKLGIDTPKLQKAITDTRNEDIDSAVANGDLTQKQADALKQKIQNSPGFGGRGFGGPGGVGPGGPKSFGFGFGGGFGLGLADAPKQFADFLGISTDQLGTEMKANGATLATVAAAHGKSRDQLKTFITDAAKTKFDAAVTNGDLTQKRADAAEKMLADNLDKIVDGHFGLLGGMGGRKFRPGGPGMPKGTPNATPNAAPQSGAGSDNTQSF